MEDLWRATQVPDLHERWDLRFTDIEYLPRPDPARPQRFRYATRIGFGLTIEGEGESVGQKDRDGERTSALRFWSNDARSLIREGSGYWRYVPVAGGIRFLTWYDYRTRFGRLGALVDRVAFRPLLGWATAWSFDRMRLWIEGNVDPAVSLERAFVHATARVSLAATWLYHGIVPKLLFPTTGELDLLAATPFLAGWQAQALALAGVAEIALGLSFLVLWRARWLFVLNAVLAVGLAALVAATTPALLAAPFQPLTLGIAMLGLSLIGLRVSRSLPSSSRCLRRPPAP